jgi:hypothetical protein
MTVREKDKRNWVIVTYLQVWSQFVTTLARGTRLFLLPNIGNQTKLPTA